MELFSKQDANIRQSLSAHINQRWGQLYELEKDWGEKALKFLLLTNSGGAIATLSFLGASQVAINSMGVKIALFLFLAGILLVGITTAKTFHDMSSLFKNWKSDVDMYYEDKITWEHLQNEDQRRAVPDSWDYVLPYTSFGFFIAGCFSGACSFLGRTIA